MDVENTKKALCMRYLGALLGLLVVAVCFQHGVMRAAEMEEPIAGLEEEGIDPREQWLNDWLNEWANATEHFEKVLLVAGLAGNIKHEYNFIGNKLWPLLIKIRERNLPALNLNPLGGLSTNTTLFPYVWNNLGMRPDGNNYFKNVLDVAFDNLLLQPNTSFYFGGLYNTLLQAAVRPTALENDFTLPSNYFEMAHYLVSKGARLSDKNGIGENLVQFLVHFLVEKALPVKQALKESSDTDFYTLSQSIDSLFLTIRNAYKEANIDFYEDLCRTNWLTEKLDAQPNGFWRGRNILEVVADYKLNEAFPEIIMYLTKKLPGICFEYENNYTRGVMELSKKTINQPRGVVTLPHELTKEISSFVESKDALLATQAIDNLEKIQKKRAAHRKRVWMDYKALMNTSSKTK